STLKRTKAETETNPLIAHVEPQVREQQQQQIPSQEQQQQQETMESNVIDTTRTDIIPIQIDNEGIRGSVEETTSLDQCNEILSVRQVLFIFYSSSFKQWKVNL
ncbi:unnamed protein product, partial [Adineta steineri]